MLLFNPPPHYPCVLIPPLYLMYYVSPLLPHCLMHHLLSQCARKPGVPSTITCTLPLPSWTASLSSPHVLRSSTVCPPPPHTHTHWAKSTKNTIIIIIVCTPLNISLIFRLLWSDLLLTSIPT